MTDLACVKNECPNYKAMGRTVDRLVEENDSLTRDAVQLAQVVYHFYTTGKLRYGETVDIAWKYLDPAFERDE